MKKLSVSVARAILNEMQKDEPAVIQLRVGEDNVEVQLKTSLTTAEKTTFIDRVLSGCFGVSGDFLPEYVTPMIRATILQMCTNVPVIAKKGEKNDDGESLLDIEAMNDIYVALGLDDVQNAAYMTMLNNIVQLTHATIDWERNKRIAQMRDARLSRIIDGINDLLDALTEKVNSLDTESLMQYAEKLTKQTEGLEDENIVKAVFDLHTQESASADV